MDGIWQVQISYSNSMNEFFENREFSVCVFLCESGLKYELIETDGWYLTNIWVLHESSENK